MAEKQIRFLQAEEILKDNSAKIDKGKQKYDPS
jgi:hypothetical protein